MPLDLHIVFQVFITSTTSLLTHYHSTQAHTPERDVSPLPSSSRKLQELSTTVWGVNANYEIYYRQGTGGWTQVTGFLKQISAAYSPTGVESVWGINPLNNIYRRGTDGNGWTQITGNFHYVSVAYSPTGVESVWALVPDTHHIYYYNGGSWTQSPGQLAQLSVAYSPTGIETVWGINRLNSVYYLSTGRANPGNWQNFATSLKHVSVAYSPAGVLTVWGIDTSDSIGYIQGTTGEWTQVTGPTLKQVSVAYSPTGVETVWGADSSNNIFYRQGSGEWTQVTGSMTQVSLAFTEDSVVSSFIEYLNALRVSSHFVLDNTARSTTNHKQPYI